MFATDRVCFSATVAFRIARTSALDAQPVVGAPTNLGPPVNSAFHDCAARVSADGLALYFASSRAGGLGGEEIWASTRPTADAPFTEPVLLAAPLNSSSDDTTPEISADGLEFYLASKRPGGSGGWDLWVARRTAVEEDFGEPMNLGTDINSAAAEVFPSVTADGIELYFASGASFLGEAPRPGSLGDGDLWVTRRASRVEPWGTPENLGPVVNTTSFEGELAIASDGLTLIFSSTPPGGSSNFGLWVATRGSREEPFGPARDLGPEVNRLSPVITQDLSVDGGTLFFASHASGSGDFDIWQVPVNMRFPHARFTVLPERGPAPLDICVDAAPSSTTDGTSVSSYAWDLGNGETLEGADAAKVCTTLRVPGLYEISLTLTNDAGNTDRAVEKVTTDWGSFRLRRRLELERRSSRRHLRSRRLARLPLPRRAGTHRAVSRLRSRASRGRRTTRVRDFNAGLSVGPDRRTPEVFEPPPGCLRRTAPMARRCALERLPRNARSCRVLTATIDSSVRPTPRTCLHTGSRGTMIP
ncbi:MAG: PD40 domain-containing protein [Planctomycetes bacterium]|nr:PD40 domain-containing protein [Planctomycetota bacterium]